jgi:hypothetical protein
MAMTKKQFDERFKTEVLPGLKAAYPNDKVAWRTCYNDTMDFSQKDGEITEKQANTWTHPQYLK